MTSSQSVHNDRLPRSGQGDSAGNEGRGCWTQGKHIRLGLRARHERIRGCLATEGELRDGDACKRQHCAEGTGVCPAANNGDSAGLLHSPCDCRQGEHS